MSENKDWFSKAKIGLFTHYIYGTYPPGSNKNYGGTCKSARDLTQADSLDELAEAFDARRFAKAADSMAAQYVTFTVSHHAGHNLLFPSRTMRDAGLPQKTSRRDLIRDILDELNVYGIKLALYYAPNIIRDLTAEEKKVLGWENDDIRRDFNCRLIREIYERYGKDIVGFWFDGDSGQKLCDTVREVNPDAVIFRNYGITENGAYFNAGREDFWVSEYFGPLPSTPSDTWPTHFSQVSRIFGGSWWAKGRPVTKVTARDLYRWTVRVAATEGQRNGGVHWAAGPYMDNEWEDGVERLMSELGAMIKRRKESLFDTLPSAAYPTPGKSVLPPGHWGVATQSLNGSKTYLHVLNAPKSDTLKLGKPSTQGCEWNFTRAEIAGKAAGLVKVENGWEITLPAGTDWDKDDTVVTLWTKLW